MTTQARGAEERRKARDNRYLLIDGVQWVDSGLIEKENKNSVLSEVWRGLGVRP